MQTFNGFQWKIGETKTTSGNSNELCNNQFLHYYHDPLLAILLNPVHANIDNPRLFEVEAEGIHLNDKGLQGGCTQLTLIRELELPKVTTLNRIAFGILCALEVYRETNFVEWANSWLIGENRNYNAAADRAADTYDAANNADDARAADAADAAAYAARAAAYADDFAFADDSAFAAAYAAHTADAPIHLLAIAKKALTYN